MKNQKDTSKSIITIAKEFKDIIELRNFCNAQHNTIEELTKKLSQFEEENNHLKKLLTESDALPVISNQTSFMDNKNITEEMICIEQINRIKSISQERILTLDEVKRLDLLVKNLRLIQNQSTENLNSVKDAIPIEVNDIELLRLAAREDGQD